MRILHWILGAAATAAATAYVAKRRARTERIDRFISALEARQVTVHSAWDVILSGGMREHLFRGVADGKPFRLHARTTKDGLRWSLFLYHGDGVGEASHEDATDVRPTVEHWNLLDGDRARSLVAVWLALKRLPVQDWQKR